MLHSFKNPPTEYCLTPDGIQDCGAFFNMSAPCVTQRAKLLSSAAHLSGSGRVQLEVILDASPSLEDMKAAIDRLQCLGVNAPRLSALRQGPPSELHRAARELLADYAARLSYALSQGKHRAQVALFRSDRDCPKYVEDSGKNLNSERFDACCECLVREHLDYDILTEESIRRAAVVDQRLMIAGEEYELLILPSTASIGSDTMLKIDEFIEDGGSVFSLESREPADLALVRDANAPALIRPEVSAKWRGKECGDLAYVHRVLDRSELFFFASGAAEPREVQLTMRCAGAPYELNLETGEAAALRNCTQRGERTILLHRFERRGSLLVYFGGEPALAIHGPATGGS